MWKYQLQQFADRTGLEVHVSHFPPGTSKWNKVEHRLFCFISKNWQGKPLVDVQTAVNLIGSTTTSAGLEVICVRDDTEYELARKVSDEEFQNINLQKISPYIATLIGKVIYHRILNPSHFRILPLTYGIKPKFRTLLLGSANLTHLLKSIHDAITFELNPVISVVGGILLIRKPNNAQFTVKSTDDSSGFLL